jgi:alpha-L-rhamnosidase
MKRLMAFSIIVLAGIICHAQSLKAVNLRCEYRVNPLGVDTKNLRFSWELQSSRSNILQSACRILVADNEALLAKNIGNVWDSKKATSAASIQVEYKGKELKPAKKYFWKVMVWDNKGAVSSWSSAAMWQMGLFTNTDWNNAQWIAHDRLPDSLKIIPLAHGRGKREWGTRKDILPLLRKDFNVSLNKAVINATVFVSGLGQFEMSLNGAKVGDHFLDPGWTQYSKHALYVTFDVTKLLKAGPNTIGMMLGNGFYYIPGERYRKLTGAYGYPKMIARLAIEYADGTIDNIVSDASWKAAPSPVIYSSIYGGEDYDANKEQSGWNSPAFNDSQWKNALLADGPPLLHSQMAEPVKVMEKFSGTKANYVKQGVIVYDLGQNFAGIPAITVAGKKGDTIRITPAELINEDGTANQRGSGGPSYYNYILKGTGTETWQPRFTYYGFRYVQVQTIAQDSTRKLPSILKVEGWHIRNAAPKTGSFRSSNDLFNQTSELIDWAIKSNTVSVFTDCPHREKLGWLEQTHLMGSSVQYNYDIASLCRKVIRDMIYTQSDDGMIPAISPEFVHFEDPFRDSPEWGSAAIILPWYAYQWYGDKQALTEAYDMMQRYIAYLQRKAVDNILSQGLGDWYDIGPDRPGFSQLTPKGVTATAIYFYDLNIMQQVARLLGKQDDSKKYRDLALAVKASFNKKFFDPASNQYATGSQTANAMALYMDLAEPAHRKAIVENLVNDIRSRNNALTAGDIGYRYLLRALEDAGRSEVIFDMNSRSDVPGYGYQLANGATALTESWQAYPSVSNNHFMLGHLMEWFYAGLCGIKQSASSIAFNKIEIRPQPVGDVAHAVASYHSVYGLIKSSWEKKGSSFQLNVSIPANTTAEIYFPSNTKYSRPLKIGSGSYQYIVQLK